MVASHTRVSNAARRLLSEDDGRLESRGAHKGVRNERERTRSQSFRPSLFPWLVSAPTQTTNEGQSREHVREGGLLGAAGDVGVTARIAAIRASGAGWMSALHHAGAVCSAVLRHRGGLVALLIGACQFSKKAPQNAL